MKLLRQVRVLIGAIVQRPFQTRPQRELEDKAGSSQAKNELGTGSPAEMQQPQPSDEERVADLIAQRREKDS